LPSEIPLASPFVFTFVFTNVILNSDKDHIAVFVLLESAAQNVIGNLPDEIGFILEIVHGFSVSVASR